MRYELTDYEWGVIKPMLPNKPRGVPRVDDRRVLNGILWVLRSGAPYVDRARPPARGQQRRQNRTTDGTIKRWAYDQNPCMCRWEGIACAARADQRRSSRQPS